MSATPPTCPPPASRPTRSLSRGPSPRTPAPAPPSSAARSARTVSTPAQVNKGNSAFLFKILTHLLDFFLISSDLSFFEFHLRLLLYFS